MLKKNATPEFVAAVKAMENRADECYWHLRLLRAPQNLALWALLTGTVGQVEDQIARWGAESPHFQAALLNLSRICPVLMRWIAEYGKPESTLVKSYRWTDALTVDVKEAIDTGLCYSSFLSCFPMWHRNRLSAECLSNGVVRFTVPGSSRERQVSAYHKGFRPKEGPLRGIRGKRVEQSSSVKRLFGVVLQEARSTGLHKFIYNDSPELVAALMPEYHNRVNTILRRADSIDLGGYTMQEFKLFYIALLITCAVHEHLCYLWDRRVNVFPHSSSIMVKRRGSWVGSLANMAGLPRQQCEKMLDDLTLCLNKGTDLHVQPFVPLDRGATTLALAPNFPLNSRWDENILRTCSHSRPEVYSVASNEKEAEMRSALVAANTRYRIEGPAKLPAPLPDIDFIVEDLRSSTVVIAELKWIRKPVKPLERIDRDAEVLHGVDQLTAIRQYLGEHPKHLMDQGRVTKSLPDYEHLQYLLIARDHWVWLEPRHEVAIVDFDPFRRLLSESTDLWSAVTDLLHYDWLPLEGRDFRVQFDRAIANSVAIESEVFYANEGRAVGRV